MTDLLELAARVEAAEGPDALLDTEIWRACIASVADLELIEVGGAAHGPSEAEFRTLRLMDSFRPTASLDAAMTLKPDGWHLAEFGEGPNLTPRPHDFAYDGTWFAMLHGVASGDLKWGSAATPALALCAAALRARAATTGEGHD